METTSPIKAGQLVRSAKDDDGITGITTDNIRTTGQIAVQWVGGPYPVRELAADLRII